MSPTLPVAVDPTRRIELSIGGTTCASCAARIEKKLNKLDGVHASVNYATEKAQVTYAESVDPAVLIATIEATGAPRRPRLHPRTSTSPTSPPRRPARPTRCAADC